MKTLSSMFFVSCIVLNLLFSGCGSKEEENNSTQNETVSKNKTEIQQQSSIQTQSNTSSSETGKIWGQIVKINESMGKSINSGKSGHLEEPVAEIIALLKTIPEKSPDIDPVKLELLKVKVNELRKSGIIMDRYQHDNKASELKEEYSKFNQALNDIKSALLL